MEQYWTVFSLYSSIYLNLNYFLFFITADKNSSRRKVKHNVIESVNKQIEEIDACHELIAEQAVEHIHQKYLS